jgi:hypothetical protein
MLTLTFVKCQGSRDKRQATSVKPPCPSLPLSLFQSLSIPLSASLALSPNLNLTLSLSVDHFRLLPSTRATPFFWKQPFASGRLLTRFRV